jgi:hypothetical protein
MVSFGELAHDALVYSKTNKRSHESDPIGMTVRYSRPAPRHTLAAVERLNEPHQESPTDTKTNAGVSEGIHTASAVVQ